MEAAHKRGCLRLGGVWVARQGNRCYRGLPGAERLLLVGAVHGTLAERGSIDGETVIQLT